MERRQSVEQGAFHTCQSRSSPQASTWFGTPWIGRNCSLVSAGLDRADLLLSCQRVGGSIPSRVPVNSHWNQVVAMTAPKVD
jgi:hypothetical protein